MDFYLKRLLFTSLLISFVGCLSVSAQLIAENYSAKEGLPSAETYFLHQDYDGYIWVCTDRGLSRYNGYEFENFTTQDGLTYNTLFNAFEDSEHNIWFTCYDGSISIFKYKTKKLMPFWGNAQLKSFLMSDTSVNLWPYCVAFKNNNAHIYSEYPVSADRYVVDLQDSIIKKSHVPKLGIYEYDNLFLDFQKTSSGGHQVKLYLKRNNTRTSADKTNNDLYNRILGNKGYQEFFSASHTQEEELLICSADAVTILRKTDTLKYRTRGATNALKDRDGNYWISTLNNGILKIANVNFKLYPIQKYLEEGDKFLSISSLGDNLILTSKLGSIVSFDLKSHKVMTPDHWGNSQSAIKEVLVVKEQLITNNGTQIANKGKIDFQEKGLSTVMGQILIELYGEGYISATSTNQIVIFKQIEDSIPVARVTLNSRILSIHAAKDGFIYVGTFNNFYRLNKDYSVTSCTDKFHLRKATVRSILSTEDSVLALGTIGKGLVVMHGNCVKEISKKDGLLSNIVHHVLSVEKGAIWCATNRGISKIEYRLGINKIHILRITNFFRNNGLGANYIHKLYFRENTIWAITEEGLVEFNATIQLNKPAIPKVHILALRRNSISYRANAIFKDYQNNLEVDFIGISTRKPPQSDFYRYKLIRDGETGEWITTNLSSLSFTKLASGVYTFFVSARSESGIWSEADQIQFTILPHWTARWWARLLLIVLIFSGVFYFSKRYLNKRKVKYEEALAVEKLRSKLNDMELEVLRGQMNPHFIYNTLGLVQKFVLEQNKLVANELIGRLSKLLRAGLEYSQYEFIYLDQEISFLDNYMGIEIKRFPKRFTYTLEVDEKLDLDISIPPLIIQPICENAVKHSYNGEKVHIVIRFSYHSEESILVSVSDDGIGYFNSRQKNTGRMEKTSLGLKVLSKRIAIFKEQYPEASYTISSPSKGTLVEIILPID